MVPSLRPALFGKWRCGQDEQVEALSLSDVEERLGRRVGNERCVVGTAPLTRAQTLSIQQRHTRYLEQALWFSLFSQIKSSEPSRLQDTEMNPNESATRAAGAETRH
ncbi:hypothetical protein AOLI_G00314550 [Acnodon oligacanthus]